MANLSNAGTAAVLSLVIPGVGQFYNGMFWRGLFWLIFTPGLWIGSGGLLGWLCHVIAAITAYNYAKRIQKEFFMEAAVKKQDKFTYADYMTWDDSERWEIINGVAYNMSPAPNTKHQSINPGDALRELFNKYSPCLILIDEWMAYARQLYVDSTVPSGTFDTHFTFAQTLSESVKAADKALLVVSIPASDNEIGGEGGKAFFVRLKKAIGRG